MKAFSGQEAEQKAVVGCLIRVFRFGETGMRSTTDAMYNV
jgi:hypothetical protein